MRDGNFVNSENVYLDCEFDFFFVYQIKQNQWTTPSRHNSIVKHSYPGIKKQIKNFFPFFSTLCRKKYIKQKEKFIHLF